MKRISFAVLFIIIALSAFSQPRQRNTIYILDCTGSMNGFNGAPDIWMPTKSFLKTELEKEAKANPESRITILPFQDKVHPAINVNPRNVSWATHEAVLDSYIKTLTATNICDAWLEGEKLIDPVRENYIVLLTDGHDNIGGVANEPKRMERFAQILRAFCGKYPNTKGYYVKLTSSAELPDEIRRQIDICKDLGYVDAEKGIPTTGDPFIDVLEVNTRDLPVDIEVGFSNSGHFSAGISGGENDFVDISLKDGVINRGRFTLHIAAKDKYGDNIEALNKAIVDDEADIDFSISSRDVIVLNPNIVLELKAKPLRLLDMLAEEATIERDHPFLWIKGNASDTLRWMLSPRFSAQAVEDNAAGMFKVSVSPFPQGGILLFDGNELPDSIITLSSSSTGIFELVVPQDVEDGSVNIEISQIHSNDLDRINGGRPENAGMSFRGEWRTARTVGEVIFWCVIGLLILIIAIWFLFARNSLYPRFTRGIITISSPYFATIRSKGYRMIVMTPVRKNQSTFDAIFRGKILYHVNSEWPCEVEITPSGNKNMRFRCPSGQLISDPMPLWQPGESYKILNTAENNRPIIELQINN